MSPCFAALLLIAASAPPPPTPEMLRRADNSIVGLLSMMGAKKSLKTIYVDRYQEAPPEFGQSGDAAYGRGWAMKAGGVLSLIGDFRSRQADGLEVVAAVLGRNHHFRKVLRSLARVKARSHRGTDSDHRAKRAHARLNSNSAI
jgi:hypothetical protein